MHVFQIAMRLHLRWLLQPRIGSQEERNSMYWAKTCIVQIHSSVSIAQRRALLCRGENIISLVLFLVLSLVLSLVSSFLPLFLGTVLGSGSPSIYNWCVSKLFSVDIKWCKGITDHYHFYSSEICEILGVANRTISRIHIFDVPSACHRKKANGWQ